MLNFVELSTKRVAWLLNHATLHDFEVPLIRSLGLEVYTCKLLPYSSQLAKDSCDILIDYSDDPYSTLPDTVLKTLNSHNFYEDEFTAEIVYCLNTYFETIFVGAFPELILKLACHFKGRVLIRVFGREQPYNYSEYFKGVGNGVLWNKLEAISDRVWFVPCYEGISEIEDSLLIDRSVVLPLGIPIRISMQGNSWVGGDKRILFVCPRILLSLIHISEPTRPY